MHLTTSFFANAEMLIRRPVAEVFEAFTDPAITTKFWFTGSSGKLETGKQVDWTWEMYQLTIPVLVKVIEPDKRVVIEWGADPVRSTVEWLFKPLNASSTFVSITDGPFTGESQTVIERIRNSTEGFTLVLAGLKAYLEHDIRLNLIGDRFPKGL